MTKKIFAMFLAVLMVVSMLPTTVFAANDCPVEHTKDNCDCTVLKVVAPTCGAYGYTSYECNDCGEIFADDYVPATGEHTLVEGEPKAPTCGKPGYEAGLDCEVCEQTIVYGATIDPVFKAGTACKYENKTPNIDCTTGGTKVEECVNCGHVKTSKVPKVGNAHAWDYEERFVIEEATADKIGVVGIPCANEACPAVKEVEWFATHVCAEAAFPHARVEATCTKDGVIAHYECRVCGRVYADPACETQLKKDEYANESEPVVGYFGNGIILKATHKADRPAGVDCCEDVKLTCTDCGKKFMSYGKHVAANEGVTVDATCTTKGYITQTCKDCNLPMITEIPAKGHVEVTVSVPSTCGTYAYTFTACMRETAACGKDAELSYTYEDEDNDDMTFDIALDRIVADQLVLDDVAYTLSVEQLFLDEVLYATSNFGTAFGATELDADAGKYGIKFYLGEYLDYKGESVEGAYRLYVKDGTDKLYMYIDNAQNIAFADADALANGDEMFWSWNEAYGFLTYDLDGYDYFLATAYDMPYIMAAPVQYLAVGIVCPAVLTYSTLEGTNLADIVIDYEAGFDADNHNKSKYEDPATCYSNGTIYWFCNTDGCGWTAEETIEKVNHKWNELGIILTYDYMYGEYDGVLKSDPGLHEDLMKIYEGLGLPIEGEDDQMLSKLFRAPTCTTAGFYFAECEYCEVVEKKSLAATGHYFDQKVKYHQDGSHTSDEYDYYLCACGEKKTFNRTSWADRNTKWDTFDEANAAHEGHLTGLTGQNVSTGSCSSAGLVKYTCPECKRAVYVKRELTAKVVINGVKETITYTSGNHYPMVLDTDGKTLIPYTGEVYTPATCRVEGEIVTYYCPVCDKTIGPGEKPGDKTVVPVTGHVFDMIVNYPEYLYVIGTAWNPCPNAKFYKCSVCYAAGENVYKTEIEELNNINAGLCDELAFEFYICSCGEEHVRGLYGDFDHKWVNYTVTEKPDHENTGKAESECAYCGEVKDEIVPTTPHVNADGDEFSDACNDSVTDRHCVLCCECTMKPNHNCAKKNSKGEYDCECMIGKKCAPVEDVRDYMNSSCTMMPYEFFICKYCDETIVELVKEAISSSTLTYWESKDAWYFSDAQKELMKVENDDGDIIGYELPYGKVNFTGHKPEKAEGDVRYANYVYKTITWNSYEWREVYVPYIDEETGNTVFKVETLPVEVSETYVAQFEKYEAPSYAADGMFKAHCEICDASVEQVLAKKSGLGIEMEAVNANGQAGFGFGSLIEVTVSINALESAIYGFDFIVEDNGMIFVGSKAVNDDFVVTVTKPEEVRHNDKALKVSGFAVNNADGKVQNIEISEKTAVVKLYFRSIVNTGKYSFLTKDAKATAMKDGALKVFQPAENYLKNEITVRGLMDFNGDKNPTSADLYQAMTMITGEHSSGKTYDVAVDLNKDGELTLEDLAIGYDYLVGNYDVADLLLMGLTEAEAEQLAHLLAKAPEHKCANPACDYASDYKFYICPKCFTFQEEIKA